jgi:hypothetical protein
LLIQLVNATATAPNATKKRKANKYKEIIVVMAIASLFIYLYYTPKKHHQTTTKRDLIRLYGHALPGRK